MRESDVFIVSIDYAPGFEARVAEIAKEQIARDNPRTLVATFMDQAFVKLVLVFELVAARSLTTP